MPSPFRPMAWGASRVAAAAAVSATPQGRIKQAERRGAELEQCAVEALQRETGSPCGTRPFPQRPDLQLAPGIAAGGRIESCPARLREGGPGPGMRIGLQPARRLP